MIIVRNGKHKKKKNHEVKFPIIIFFSKKTNSNQNIKDQIWYKNQMKKIIWD
jgi:hypothetical protein